MKRIIYSAICLAILSCTKAAEEGTVDLSLTVSGEQLTKVGMTENGSTVWNTGDDATVFYKSSSQTRWFYYGEDGSAVGHLKYTGNPFETSGTQVVAMMPYNETAVLEDGVLSFDLPSEQLVAAGGGVSPVLVVSTASDNLVFSYATALVKVALKGYGSVKSFSIAGNAGEVLCGAASVDMTSDRPLVRLCDDASGKSIRVSAKDGGLLACLDGGEAALYVSVPEMSFEDGFTLTVEYSRGGKQNVKYTDAISLSASKVYDLGSIEAMDELVLEVDFNQGKSNAADAVKAIKSVYGVTMPAKGSTPVKDAVYSFNVDGTVYDFKFGYCPDTDTSSSSGHYMGDNNGQACLLISTNGWYISLPKIENHVLHWFSTVAGRTIDSSVASSTEYFITTNVSSTRGVARNNCVSDRLMPPQNIGEEYVAYIGDGDPSADYFLTQYAGGWLYIQNLKLYYRRIR